MVSLSGLLGWPLSGYPSVRGEVDNLLEAIEVARTVIAAASDKKAVDIALLDTREVCSFADYFVICSGESNRQIEAIRDEVIQALKKDGVVPRHYEGTADSGWLLLDYYDVVVHIFAPLERQFYQLDKLWGEAATVVKIQ